MKKLFFFSLFISSLTVCNAQMSKLILKNSRTFNDPHIYFKDSTDLYFGWHDSLWHVYKVPLSQVSKFPIFKIKTVQTDFHKAVFAYNKEQKSGDVMGFIGGLVIISGLIENTILRNSDSPDETLADISKWSIRAGIGFLTIGLAIHIDCHKHIKRQKIKESAVPYPLPAT